MLGLSRSRHVLSCLPRISFGDCPVVMWLWYDSGIGTESLRTPGFLQSASSSLMYTSGQPYQLIHSMTDVRGMWSTIVLHELSKLLTVETRDCSGSPNVAKVLLIFLLVTSDVDDFVMCISIYLECSSMRD